MGLSFSNNVLIHVRFTSELKSFAAYCVFVAKRDYIVLHDFNLTYYSSIVLGSFSILLFPKLCWHIGLTPKVKSVYPTAKIFLGGDIDFNSPGINWYSGAITNSYVSASFREKLIEVSEEFHLEQLVLEPTRQHNIWICASLAIQVLLFPAKHLPTLVIMRLLSSHFLVGLVYQSNLLGRFICIIKPTGMKSDQVYYMFQKYTLKKTNSARSVEDNWNYFHSHCLKIIENHVPTKLLSTRSHLPWLTTPLRCLIRKKQQVYNKANKYHQQKCGPNINL